VFDLAAAYGYGFAKNHCFVDGNKRIALISINVFLIMNGFQLTALEEEAALSFLDLAGRIETQDEWQSRLAQWIRENSKTSAKG
jgi:death on curing protein